MTFWKNIKFVRKIQFGFLLIAGIATLIVVNDLFRVNSFNKSEQALEVEVTTPKENIEKISVRFREIQFTLLKFSVKEFESDFATFFKDVTAQKAEIDTLIGKLSIYENDKDLGESVKNIRVIWKNYKNVVADAIVSAGVMKDFEMAAVVATSSGEEVGKNLATNLDQILAQLQTKSMLISKDMQEKTKLSLILIIIGMIAGATIFGLCAFLLAPAISKPIKLLIEQLQNFALGDFDHASSVESHDEFGELSGYLEKVRVAQREKITAAENIADGKFDYVKAASEHDKLAFAFNKVVDTINSIISDTSLIIEANRLGDLSYRGNVEKFSGGWKQFIKNMNSTLETFSAPLKEALHSLEMIADGDLTQKITSQFMGDYQKIALNINKVVDSLSEAMGRVTEAAAELSASASQISSSAEEMAAGATEQSTQTSEIAEAVEVIARSSAENASNAKLATDSAKIAGKKAKESGDVIYKTIDGINKLSDVMTSSANSVRELGKNSDQIGEIIQVIDDIADQTNLLALNAAIEAARAGEQGRGFAVVADEVRKLAERTSKATKEISLMIKKIQSDTGSAVKTMEQGTHEVETGKRLAADAVSALKEIIDLTMENAGRMDQLADANEAQSTSNDEISRVIDQINNVTQQSANGIQQISQSSENLYRLTNILQDMLSKFRLSSIQITKKKNYLN